MSRKSVLQPFRMIDAGDISGNLTSVETSTINLDSALILITWTGTSPVGTVTVEGRNGTKSGWVTINMGASIDISGNSGDHQLIFTELPFTDMRLKYAATSGSGSMIATITAKVKGA